MIYVIHRFVRGYWSKFEPPYIPVLWLFNLSRIHRTRCSLSFYQAVPGKQGNSSSKNRIVVNNELVPDYKCLLVMVIHIFFGFYFPIGFKDFLLHFSYRFGSVIHPRNLGPAFYRYSYRFCGLVLFLPFYGLIYFNFFLMTWAPYCAWRVCHPTVLAWHRVPDPGLLLPDTVSRCQNYSQRNGRFYTE